MMLYLDVELLPYQINPTIEEMQLNKYLHLHFWGSSVTNKNIKMQLRKETSFIYVFFFF